MMERENSRQENRNKIKINEEEKQIALDAQGTNWLSWNRKQCEEFINSKIPDVRIKAMYKLAVIEQGENRIEQSQKLLLKVMQLDKNFNIE